MTKVAITLPADQFAAIERIRRQHRQPRSHIIQQAVAAYLSQQGLKDLLDAYEQGYRRKPESLQEADAYAHAAAEVLGSEEWS